MGCTESHVVAEEDSNKASASTPPLRPNMPLPCYSYRKLKNNKTIRLIALSPCRKSDKDQRLKCKLEVVRLAENPSYAALSYTWGENVFSETLTCDNSVLNITKNLHAALVRFRLPDHPLYIWADAVCINQADDAEKSHQIPLMADIYSRATEVLIWLGEAFEGSNDIMIYLKRIGQKFVERGGEIKEPRDERSPENDAIWADVVADPNLEKTHLIWTRPWFSRLWVIQEIVFASRATVHCGAVSVDWDVLFAAGTALCRAACDGSLFWNSETNKPRRLRSGTAMNMLKLDEIRKSIRADESKTSTVLMYDLLESVRFFQCRDPKDKVFGLLSIFNRGRNKPFQIGYEKSEAEVFLEFARYCLRSGDTVDILSFAGEANHALIPDGLNLPTWVPDWRFPAQSPTDIMSNFRAGHRVTSSVEVDDSCPEFLSRGMMVDKVIGIVSEINSFKDPEQTQAPSYLDPQHVPQWYLQVEVALVRLMRIQWGTARKYIAGGDTWEALARTLIIDWNDQIFDSDRGQPQRKSKFKSPKPHEGFSGFRGLMASKLFPTPPEEPDSSGPPLIFIAHEDQEYFERAISISADKCFFITKMGYIGLGPKGMKSGDVICVLAGSSVPYVVRPLREDFQLCREGNIPIRREAYFVMPNGEMKPYILREDEVKYRLIGECYAHGLMHGEVWDLNYAIFEDFRFI